MAKSEFGQFLISRRARLNPGDVGLPDSGRRRTPGLRREEVAALAGVSVDYLARLEQGRDSNPSVSIIGALADALQLDDAERKHFGWLAITSDNKSACPGDTPADEKLSPAVEAILYSVDTAAFVIGRNLDVVGWNEHWEKFATPLGLLDESARRNLAWHTFAAPTAPKMIRNWAEVADSYTSRLRAATVRWPNDSELNRTIEELQQFPEFARRWEEHLVDDKTGGVLRIAHPRNGNVEFEYETLELSDLCLVVWLTERSAARANVLRLVEDRAVND